MTFMATETVERGQDFDVDAVSYAEAIERTESELRERHDVDRILRINASCDNSQHEWWVKVEARIHTDDE